MGALGAFVFAIIIVKNISFKKDLIKKQLDTVFKLVTDLQNLQLFFSFNIDRLQNDSVAFSHSGDIWFYFFDMTKEKYQTIEPFKNSKPSIFVSETFLYENEIFKFINVPFLPQSIALKLINFYYRGGNQMKYEIGRNQVFISDDRLYDTHIYRQEISQYYLTPEKIFETTELLNKSIRRDTVNQQIRNHYIKV